MEIIYHGPYRHAEIADTGQVAVNGEPTDVPDELAMRLLEQPTNWRLPTQRKPAATKGDK